MDEKSHDELLDSRSELRRKILILEWDKKSNQITFTKDNQLKECKQELERIESELGLQGQEKC